MEKTPLADCGALFGTIHRPRMSSGILAGHARGSCSAPVGQTVRVREITPDVHARCSRARVRLGLTRSGWWN
eukprot:5599294-Pyramimonas_sp.AAC.1